MADSPGLDRAALRGLIGELLVLENRLLQRLGLDEAVSAWTGPLGMAQDFRLPSGQRIEVKAVDRDADSVLVNGLGQLDGGGDPIQLAVVRLEDTGRNAPDALTAPLLVGRLRTRLADSPSALGLFNSMLRFVLGGRWGRLVFLRSAPKGSRGYGRLRGRGIAPGGGTWRWRVGLGSR